MPCDLQSHVGNTFHVEIQSISSEMSRTDKTEVPSLQLGGPANAQSSHMAYQIVKDQTAEAVGVEPTSPSEGAASFRN